MRIETAGDRDITQPSSAPHSHTSSRLALIALLVAYVALAVDFSITMPILESSDENWHEAAVWTIASGGGLPVLRTADKGKLLVPAQEAGQPPLYYLIEAAATWMLHEPNPATVEMPSPNPDIGIPSRSNWHKNLFVHTNAESFPWHGLPLAVHIHRFISILFGALALTVLWNLARISLKESISGAALAVSLVAFNPMFVFITSSVDNDSLAILLGTIILFLLARVLMRRAVTTVDTLLLGFSLGLATLTKLSVASLGLPTAVVLARQAWRQRSWRALARWYVLVAIPVVALTGWWFARNWVLYGDPLGLTKFVALAGGRSTPLSFQELLKELPGIWIGFWGVLGAYDVLLPAWQYTVYDVLAALSGVGLAFILYSHLTGRRRLEFGGSAEHITLLAASLVLEFLLLIRWTASTEASSGRLLYPVIGSAAVLLSSGLLTFLRRGGGLAVAVLSSLLAAITLADLPLAILPAYATPVLVRASSGPTGQYLDWHYGNLELRSVQLPQSALRPGDRFLVGLDWMATGPITQNLMVSVRAFDPTGKDATAGVRQNDAFPGGGKVLTSRWPVGYELIDHVPVRLSEHLTTPVPVFLQVIVYPVGEPSSPLVARAPSGVPVNPATVGRVIVEQPGAARTPEPLGVSFASTLVLVRARLTPAVVLPGGTLHTQVVWYAKRHPAADYTVFVHVGPPTKPPLAQKDSPPLDGAFPTTQWLAHETVTDDITVPIPSALPPGTYPVSLGVYVSRTGQRLTLANGQSLVSLGNVTVGMVK
ncbi:MAG: glycosyltransferase family 39 protein [Chloroflexi bacterium]|nr:glycosyltransferase family 39 protein [Chloroflexota bacterium]